MRCAPWSRLLGRFLCNEISSICDFKVDTDLKYAKMLSYGFSLRRIAGLGESNNGIGEDNTEEDSI